MSLALSGCSGSADSTMIDNILGAGSNAPVLSGVPTQILQQTQELNVDVNNVKKSAIGDDKDMSYTCKWSRLTGGPMTDPADCTTLPNGSATFNGAAGILKWTPSTAELGQYKIAITGTNLGGSDTREFTADVRLKFAGLESLTNVQGDRMTLSWTANTSAAGYQILRKNPDGTYAVFQTITNSALSTITVTSLVPLTSYTFRLTAIDSLGQLDGNQVTLSAVTADLIRLEVTASASQLSPGQTTTVTVRLKDNGGNYLTTSGLSVAVAMNGGGTSNGTFSAVNDLGNGVYTSVFTATTPGTADTIVASLPQFYYVETAAPMQVKPLKIEILASATSLNPNQAITLTAKIRDFNGILMSQGGHSLAFNYAGGTSTASISAALDSGVGTYTATLTGLNAGTPITIGATISTTSEIYSTQAVQVLPYTIELTSALADLSVTRSTTITARVKDWQGNFLTTGGQGLQIAINGSAGILSIGATTDNSNGTYTATVTGLSLGTVSLTATMTPSFTVTQQALVAVKKLRLEILTSAANLMPGQTATLTGRVKDWQGNIVGVGGQAFDFSASGGTSAGSISTVTDNGNGTYTATFTASSAGTALTVSGSITDTFQVDTTASIQVQRWRVYVTTSASSIQTGQVINATVTVKDYLDNTAAAGGQTVSLLISGGTSTGVVSAVTDNSNGTYSATITASSVGTVATVSASLLQSYQVIQTANLTVLPIYLGVTVQNAQMNPGGTSYVYAQVQDAAAVPLTTGSYTISFSYSGGTSTGSFSSVTNMGNGLYRATFTGASGGTAITISASATSTYTVASTQTITVVPWDLRVTASSTDVTVGQSLTLTGRVYDYTGALITTGGKGFTMATVNTGIGNLSAVADNTDGTYTASFAAVGVGTTGISATVTSSYTLTSTVTLNSTAVHLYLTAPQSQLNPGDGVTVNAEVKNSSGVALITGSYTIGFTYGGGSSTGALSSTLNPTPGNYTSIFTGNVAGSAIAVTANASVPYVVDQTASLQVRPWNIEIVGLPTSYAIYESGSIQASVKDWSGSTVTSGGKGISLSLASSGYGNISGTTDMGDGTYAANFQAMAVGSVGVAANMSQSFTVSSAPTLTIGQVYLYVTVGSGGSTSTAINSGDQVTARVTLKNSGGQTVTGTGYAVNFNVGGGSSSLVLDTAVTQESTGVYKIVYHGVNAGTPTTVSASTNVTHSLSGTGTVTVNPNPVINAALSNLTVSANTVRSGNSVILTATMKDLNGNLIPSLPGVTFSNTSGPGVGSGTFSATVPGGPGVYTANFVGNAQGTATTIKATSGGVDVSQTVNVAVTSGIPSLMTLTAPSIVSAGGCAATPLSLVFKDSAGNSTTLPSDTIFSINSASLGYGQIFSDPGCNALVLTNTNGATDANLSFTVLAGQSGVSNMYFKSFVPQTYAPVFSAPGITQDNNPISTVSSVISWMGAMGTLDSNAAGYSYGNTAYYGAGIYDGMFTTGAHGVTVSTEGGVNYLYVGDQSSHSVHKFDISNPISGIPQVGRVGRVQAGKGIPTGGTNPSLCTSFTNQQAVDGAFCTGGVFQTGTGDGMFNAPTRVTTMNIGGVDHMFITDTNNHRIMKYRADGTFLGWTGLVNSATGMSGCTGGSAPGTTGVTTPGWCKGGTATASVSGAAIPGAATGGTATSGNQFRSPTYITNDGTSLYVFDSGNNRILQIDPTDNAVTGGLVTRWMGRISSTALTSATNSKDGLTWPTALSCYGTTQSDGVTANTNGGFTTSWCTGGSSVVTQIAIGLGTNVNFNPHFYSPRAIHFYSDGTNNWMLIADGQFGRISRFLCGPASATPNCSDANTTQTFTATTYYRGNFFGYTGWTGGTAPNAGGAVPAAFASYINTNVVSASANTNGWAYWGGAQNTGNFGGLNNPYGMAMIGSTLYVSEVNTVRVTRINLADGKFTGWMGRISATPTGGNPGCAGANAGSVTPGWCTGGTATAGSMQGAFNSILDIATDGTYLYTMDRDNFRVQIHNASTGLVVGGIGLRLNAQPQSWSTVPPALSGVMPPVTTLNTWFPTRDNIIYNGDQLYIDGDYMYLSEVSHQRIKRYRWTDGLFTGWVGLTSSVAPTGGDLDCIGSIVGGFTPGWCKGGSFTSSVSFGFSSPRGMTSDGTFLYVVDQGNHRIVRIEKATGQFKGWIGGINAASPPSDGESSCSGSTATTTPGWCLGGQALAGRNIPQFNTPYGIAGYTDPNDSKFYLVIGDSSNARLVKVDAATGTTGIGWVGVNNSGGAACGVAQGQMVMSWCTTQNVTAGVINTTAPSANMNNGYLSGTRSLWMDNSVPTAPVLYVTSNNGRIQRFNPVTGAFTGWVGYMSGVGNAMCESGTAAVNVRTPSWCMGGTVSAGTLGTQLSGSVTGVYTDASNLYAVDSNNHRLMKWDKSTGNWLGWQGRVLSNSSLGPGCTGTAVGAITPTWCTGGTSQAGFLMDPTNKTTAFDTPQGMTGVGNLLFIMDQQNSRIISYPTN